jgi:hypothetical protein
MNSGASESKGRFRLLKATFLSKASSLSNACGLSSERVSNFSRPLALEPEQPMTLDLNFLGRPVYSWLLVK